MKHLVAILMSLFFVASPAAAGEASASHQVVLWTSGGTIYTFAADGDGRGKRISSGWKALAGVEVMGDYVYVLSNPGGAGSVLRFKLGSDGRGVRVAKNIGGAQLLAADGGHVFVYRVKDNVGSVWRLSADGKGSPKQISSGWKAIRHMRVRSGGVTLVGNDGAVYTFRVVGNGKGTKVAKHGAMAAFDAATPELHWLGCSKDGASCNVRRASLAADGSGVKSLLDKPLALDGLRTRHGVVYLRGPSTIYQLWPGQRTPTAISTKWRGLAGMTVYGKRPRRRAVAKTPPSKSPAAKGPPLLHIGAKNSIYRVEPTIDGRGRHIFAGAGILGYRTLDAADGWIYAQVEPRPGKTSIVRFQTGEAAKPVTLSKGWGSSGDLAVAGGWVYLRRDDNDIWRFKIGGDGKGALFLKPPRKINVDKLAGDGNRLYFSGRLSREFHVIEPGAKTPKLVATAKAGIVEDFDVYGGVLSYLVMLEKTKAYEVWSQRLTPGAKPVRKLRVEDLNAGYLTLLSAGQSGVYVGNDHTVHHLRPSGILHPVTKKWNGIKGFVVTP